MNDRKLLLQAAKAAGVGPVLCYESRRNLLRIGNRKTCTLWNPLYDRAQAIELLVKFQIRLDYAVDIVTATGVPLPDYIYEDLTEDGVCRVIVRYVARIGATL